MRLFGVVAAIFLVTIVLLPVQWIAVRFSLPPQRRLPVLFHRIICALIGVRVQVLGSLNPHHPLLIVANHVSWLDISVITSLSPVAFIAKHEVASWPLFGLFAKLQRSIFVDRSKRQKTGDVTARIGQRLADGDPMVLFGEGTSSDGNRVLEFRSALIGAARDALSRLEGTDAVWIQPMSIAYTGLVGLPLGRQHRPHVAWYGDFDLLPHLANLIRYGGIDVTVTWGEPIPFDAVSDRKAVARMLENQVRAMTANALRGRRQPAGGL